MPTGFPPDHDQRLARARLSLEGLSVGDAFGEQFFIARNTLLIQFRDLPPGPWAYTDDTAMAVGLYRILEQHGQVDQDQLAQLFASNYVADPIRGYGGSIQGLLRRIHDGGSWRELSSMMFGGSGSMGNGAAMRIGPLGAYYAEERPETVVEQAILSAAVTHFHEEAKASAAAVALAVQWVTQHATGEMDGREMLRWTALHLPHSETRDRVRKVGESMWDFSNDSLISTVGNGFTLLAQDTVPLCLWVAAHHLDSFEDAMWAMVSCSGDMDTNCAIAGSIVAMAVGRESIPAAWIAQRENPLSEA